jgi:alanine racemase
MDGNPEALVDLGTIKANVAALARHVGGGAAMMAVVKADGYGHGMVPTAAAALAGGASWLGVAHVAEGVALREAGFTVPVLCLLGAESAATGGAAANGAATDSAATDGAATDGAAHARAISHDVDLTAGSAGLVRQIAAAARRAGRPARLHLKADTGMGRGGATAADWPGVVDAALAAEADGLVRIVGLWSHLACADMPGHPSIAAQVAAFRAAVGLAERAGARPQVRHLANSAGTLTLPETWFDLVRPAGMLVGLSTMPGGGLPPWLRPAMTVRARLVQVKRVPAGQGVSYGLRYVTSAPSTLGLVPLGYDEGVPRHASGRAEVLVRGRRWRISGTVCMNQFVLDLGDEPARPGDEVVLFGPGDSGEPTAADWADALDTISYEIVTRFTGKIPRRYSGLGELPAPALAAATGAGDGGVPAASAAAAEAR